MIVLKIEDNLFNQYIRVRIRNCRGGRTLKKFIAIILAMSLFSACSLRENEEKEAPSTKVLVISPEISSIESYTTVVGKTAPKKTIHVLSEMSEKVVAVHKKTGDFVRKGELLMELDDESVRLKLDSARAELETARANALKLTGSAPESALIGAESGNIQVKNAKKVMEANIRLLEQNISKVRKGLRELESGIAGIEKLQTSIPLPDDSPISAIKPFLPPSLEIPNSVTTVGQLKASLVEKKKELEKAKEKLEESYDTLVKSYDNSKELLDEQQRLSDEILSVTKNDLAKELEETAEAILDVSELSYKIAEKELQKTKIYAEMDGYVDFVGSKENNFVAEGANVFTISNRDKARIEFNLSGQHVRNLNLGDKVIIKGTEDEIVATIIEIPPMIDLSSGQFKIVAEIDSDLDTITYGSSYFVKIPTEQKTEVLCLPIDCVYFDGEESFVYIASEDGKTAIKAKVKTGIYNDKEIEIIDGISKEDRVISSWSKKLKDKELITIAKSSDNITILEEDGEAKEEIKNSEDAKENDILKEAH